MSGTASIRVRVATASEIARLGSYTNPMSPTETTAFIHKQQQTWQPVLDEIARKQR